MGSMLHLPENSADLLSYQWDTGSVFADKIYVTCRVHTRDNHQFTVIIDETCPLAASSLGIQSDYPHRTVLVSDLQQAKNNGLSLISGGVFVSMLKAEGDRYLLALRRDKCAPSAPNCITEPAGRLDAYMESVCVNEANEELIIAVIPENTEHKRIKIPVFDNGLSNISAWRMYKVMQYAKKMDHIIPLNPKIGHPKIETVVVPVQFGVPKWTGLPESRLTIRTPTRNDTYSGFVWMDTMCNTLEFRSFAELDVDRTETLVFKDGEDYGRESITVPLPERDTWSRMAAYGPLTPVMQHISTTYV